MRSIACVRSHVRFFIPGVRGSIQTAPRNQIVTVGSDVTFNCSSDIVNKTITWIYKPPYKTMTSSSFPITISNGTVKQPPLSDKVVVQNYTVSDREIVYSLTTIKKVQFADAGLYTCQDNNGYGQQVRGALLAILGEFICIFT